MTKLEWVWEQVDNLPDYKFVELWNQYCHNNHNDEDKLYPMEKFNMRFYGYTPLLVADIVACGRFNINDDWFRVSGNDTAVYSDCDAKFLVDGYFEELVENVAEYLSDYEEFIPEEDYLQFVKDQVFDGDEEVFSRFIDWFHEEYVSTAKLSDFDIDDILTEFQETQK